jgi:transposase-like protein
MAKGLHEEWRTEENLELIKAWRRDGLKYDQIANNIGISEKTLYEWQNKYSEIRDALKKGKELADIEVENATFKSAIGFREKVKKPIKITEKMFGDNGRMTSVREKIEYVDEEVYYPPNMTAAIFWLKNRKPNDWKDRNITVGIQKPDSEVDGFSQSIIDFVGKENV